MKSKLTTQFYIGSKFNAKKKTAKNILRNETLLGFYNF